MTASGRTKRVTKLIPFRNEFTHVAPIETSVLAQSEKNKHVGGAGPANQNESFTNTASSSRRSRSKQQDGGRSCRKTL